MRNPTTGNISRTANHRAKGTNVRDSGCFIVCMQTSFHIRLVEFSLESLGTKFLLLIFCSCLNGKQNVKVHNSFVFVHVCDVCVWGGGGERRVYQVRVEWPSIVREGNKGNTNNTQWNVPVDSSIHSRQLIEDLWCIDSGAGYLNIHKNLSLGDTVFQTHFAYFDVQADA